MARNDVKEHLRNYPRDAPAPAGVRHTFWSVSASGHPASNLQWEPERYAKPMGSFCFTLPWWRRVLRIRLHQRPPGIPSLMQIRFLRWLYQCNGLNQNRMVPAIGTNKLVGVDCGRFVGSRSRCRNGFASAFCCRRRTGCRSDEVHRGSAP